MVVAPEGINLLTRTGSVGQFRLSNVPADQSLTIDVTNPQDSVQISRYNVMVRPGETLDIGSMDLVTCPLVGLPTQPQDDSQRQQEQRGPGPELLKFRQVLRVEGRPRHDTAAALPAERRLQPPSARLKCCVLDQPLYSSAGFAGSAVRGGRDQTSRVRGQAAHASRGRRGRARSLP